MKSPTRKSCCSTKNEAPLLVRPIIISPLPARHCSASRTTNHASGKTGITKACALIAIALVVVSTTNAAAKAASIPTMDRDTPATANSAPATSAGVPSTAAHPSPTLAPAAPITSPVPPVNAGEDIREIRSPRSLPNPWAWAAYAAGALALMTGAFGVWLWFRRDRFIEKLPYELALEQLEDARRYLTAGQAREFCVAVSEIIRGYIELRFNTRAAHRTTEEFLRDLIHEKRDLLVTHRDPLAQFLQHCDMAKFALWRFSVPEMEAMLSSARSFVLQSVEVPNATAAAMEPAALPKAPRIHLDSPAPARVHATPKPA